MNMLLMLSPLILLSFIKNPYAINWFPVADFFNISESKVQSFSKYLCSIKPLEEKCCDCEIASCFSNCCIDLAWDPFLHTDLNEYLKELFAAYKDENDIYETTCQPAITHIPAVSPTGAATEHFVENQKVLSFLFDDDDNITDCIDYRNKEFTFMPFMDDVGTIVNKQCLEVLQMNEPIKKYLPVKVHCAETYNLTSDMVFDVESLDRVKKCIFVVDTYNDSVLEWTVEAHRCIHSEGSCDRTHHLFQLCEVYFAPIRGYRNIHCAQCDNKPWYRYENVEPCQDCSFGICDLHKRLNIITYPVSFSLIPDEHGTEYRVKNTTKSFPVVEFFGVVSVAEKDTNRLLCGNGVDTCCSCNEHCMKFHICCMNMLWNNTSPLKVDKYKELFIEAASQYKQHTCVDLLPGGAQYQMITKCYTSSSGSTSGPTLGSTSKSTAGSTLNSTSGSTLWTEEDKRRCLNPDNTTIKSMIPVIGSDRYLYRNLYCARCNGVEKFKPVDLVCLHEHVLPEAFDIKKRCLFEIVVGQDGRDADAVQECDTRQKSHVGCDPAHEHYNLCKSYSGDLVNYKNYHCYLCHNSNVALKIPIEQKCDDFVIIKPNLRKKTFVKFAIDNFRVSSITPARKYVCESTNIFEMFGSKCRKMKIDTLKDNEFDRCINGRNLTLFATQKNQVIEEIEKNKIARNISIKEKLSGIFYFVSRNVSIEEYLSDSSRTIYRIHLHGIIGTDTVIANYFFDLKNLLEAGAADYFILSQTEEPIIDEKHNVSFGNSFLGGKRICYNLKTLERSKISFTNSCRIDYNNRTSYDLSDTNTLVVFDRFNASRYIRVCEQYYMASTACSLKIIDANLTKDDNGTISYREQDKLLNKTVSEYMPVLKGAAVCVYEGPNVDHTWIQSMEKCSFIISVTGRTLNLFFSAKIAHALFPVEALRGHLCLTLSLFLIDTSSITAIVMSHLKSIQGLVVCHIVAIVTHFGFMMAQLWCMFCCFDLWSNLATTYFRFDRENRFTYYGIVTVLTSLAVVVFGFSMDSTGHITLGYVDHEKCMPYNLLGQFCFYIFPLVLTTALSASFLSRTIMYVISKREKENPHAGEKEKLQVAYLTLKIILVVEFVETFGFIREYDGHGEEGGIFFKVFGLLTAIVNGARGILMFCVFYDAKQRIQGSRDMFRLASSKTLSVHSVVNGEAEF